jgi:pyridoxal phosphate enzyme (YggS family)
VKERISRSCSRAGRALEAIRLLAVSKHHSLAKIEDLYHAGQHEFAENYLSELSLKAAALKNLAISWVFIGRLQSNKIKRIVEIADEIQSAASIKHLEYIARYAKEAGKCPYPVYLEVNAGDEASKGGWQLGQLESLGESLLTRFPELALQGIMAIPPRFAEEGSSAQVQLYTRLRRAADKVGKGKLSLGMSEDLEAAIAAGSDCVRIGTALFGERNG